MPVKKDKEYEYKAWTRAMLEKRMKPIVCLAVWFFNLIDLKKLDIGSIIFMFCHTCELYEMFGITESDKCRIYFSVKAVAEYHDRGEEFRTAWNTYWWLKGDEFKVDTKKMSDVKYIFNPYIK